MDDKTTEYTLKTFNAKDYSNINFNAVGDIIGEWEMTASEFESSVNKAADDPTFKVLKTIELASGFPDDFDKGVAAIIQSIVGTINETTSYMESLLATDGNLAGLIPKREDYGNPSGNTSNTAPPDYETGAGNNTNAEDQITPPETTFAPFPNGGPALDLNTITSSDYEKIYDLIFKMSQDSKLSEGMLDFGSHLKEELLKLDISDDFRKSLEKAGNDYILQISDLFNKNNERYKINEASDKILKEFISNVMLEKMEKENLTEISAKDVKNDVIKSLNTVVDFMKTNLSSINKTTGKPDIDPFLTVYDGAWEKENITSKDVTLVRNILEFLAEKKEVNVEDLFQGDKYIKDMDEIVNDLGKGREYLSILNTTSDENFDKNTYDSFKEGLMLADKKMKAMDFALPNNDESALPVADNTDNSSLGGE